jgi:hypothetical protein
MDDIGLDTLVCATFYATLAIGFVVFVTAAILSGWLERVRERQDRVSWWPRRPSPQCEYRDYHMPKPDLIWVF